MINSTWACDVEGDASHHPAERVVASDIVLIQGDVMTRESVGDDDDVKHSGGNHFTIFPVVGLFHTQVAAYSIALQTALIKEEQG